jgi:diguanylate cyclase (GGDEF)-like protein/PAS domain S-box-containing protein
MGYNRTTVTYGTSNEATGQGGQNLSIDAPAGGAPPAMGVLDHHGQLMLVNEDLASLLGVDASELVGQDIFRFVDEDQRPAARQALRRAARTGRVSAAVWRAQAGAHQFQLALQPQPLSDPHGGRVYVVTASTRAMRSGPVQRQAMLATIAEECDEAIVSSGPGGQVEIWNHAAQELFGWSEKEAVGNQVAMLVPHERQVEAQDLMARAWAGEVLARVETVRVCKHGSRVEVSVTFTPLHDRWGQVTGVSQLVRDITQQKASERALAYQAMHDHLTGLPNRSLLEDRMAHALERCRREGQDIGVIFFDVDHFKTVNDTAGHEVGDKLLRAVASRLRQSVRSMDTVARMGGDEFVVLCEDITDDAQLDTIVSHIMRTFSEPVMLPDRQLWVGVSAGVVKGGPSASVAQLLSQADAAMYQAKERARGSVGHYDPKTRPDLERRAEGSRLLRLALEAHQLVPYYQPIIDLHSGLLVGAEALVRWEDPVRGVVEAKDFIPLAEQLGLVGEISDLVLAEAAHHIKDWVQIAPSLRIAVNISPLQLRGPGLLNCIKTLLDEGVKPSSMILEVTESALLDDTATTTSVLTELREAGFGIAIDDFGTGYSSLAYLKQLPATGIKVDRTFTSQLPDPHDLSVVMAILAIADTYGLEVVAEGIESPLQAEVLKELGCQHGQGYHFARPMPAADFSKLVELHRPLPPAGAPAQAGPGLRPGNTGPRGTGTATAQDVTV